MSRIYRDKKTKFLETLTMHEWYEPFLQFIENKMVKSRCLKEQELK